MRKSREWLIILSCLPCFLTELVSKESKIMAAAFLKSSPHNLKKNEKSNTQLTVCNFQNQSKILKKKVKNLDKRNF
ncbi:MAG: hypothetical protein IJ669_07955, partial [Prevotella sp.]|nr:hypothetical protein [Prevotella sp.]